MAMGASVAGAMSGSFYATLQIIARSRHVKALSSTSCLQARLPFATCGIGAKNTTYFGIIAANNSSSYFKFRNQKRY